MSGFSRKKCTPKSASNTRAQHKTVQTNASTQARHRKKLLGREGIKHWHDLYYLFEGAALRDAWLVDGEEHRRDEDEAEHGTLEPPVLHQAKRFRTKSIPVKNEHKNNGASQAIHAYLAKHAVRI